MTEANCPSCVIEVAWCNVSKFKNEAQNLYCVWFNMPDKQPYAGRCHLLLTAGKMPAELRVNQTLIKLCNHSCSWVKRFTTVYCNVMNSFVWNDIQEKKSENGQTINLHVCK